jgi:hypothetical protein
LKLRRLVVLGVLALTGGSALAVPSSTANSVEPQAKDLLQKMSDYLGSQPELSVRTDGATEVVRDNGQRIEFDHSSLVRLKRPDKLRADRRGDLAAVELYYDGHTFSLFGKEHRYYAQSPAPPNIDQAIADARERLGIEAPAADLLYARPYEGLMGDVVSGMYVGKSFVGDTACHHLAFRGNETDWQIWIDAGATPLPRKLVIVSKKVKGTPEFRVALSEWNVSPKLDDAVFRFVPPPDATKIDFLPQKGGTK